MKVLLIHSYYQQRGGEDVVFEQESKLLAQGATVKQLSFSNRGGVRGALQFLYSIWNRRRAMQIKKAVTEFQPDVVHLHNLHFAVGPLVIRKIAGMKVPMVLTLHNFRMLCPSATLSHDGQLFTESLRSSFPWKAIQKKVYRDSMLMTFWLAFIVWFHKKIGTWSKVDRFLVLNEFMKGVFAESTFGVEAEKIQVKPNFVELPVSTALAIKGDHVLFVGRLTADKGVPVLLDAFSEGRFRLHIAGDGPLRGRVEEAAKTNPNITYLGSLNRDVREQAMKECALVVVPSIWYEAPLTVMEAFAAGTPVIASNLGAMAAAIQPGHNGLRFEAGNSRDLQEQLERWFSLRKKETDRYSANALECWRNRYSPEKNKELLLSIYQNVAK
jgi:glycosyltransferase involved in cell wall biosynthesis